MFCDLVGSTALSARLDPEDMREIIAAYHRCCAEQMTKAGGFVAKYMGDGVLAYFGYPQAHEDDAERAVRAALSLIKAVPILRTGHDVALQVRVGIATGVVVVGDLIGEGAAQEQGVVGESPNLAARLQALAEPGQVVVSQRTRRLAGGLFEYRDLGRIMLKGLVEPTKAWQVIGASTVESRFEAQHETGLTPLVGREKELELLFRRWQTAKSGEGQVVLLSGEPGIGKSRLTAAMLERLQGEAHTRLRYFCSPQHIDSALYPIITQLERAAGFKHDDAAHAKLDKLDAVTWTMVNRPPNENPGVPPYATGHQGDYNQALAVSPLDCNTVAVGWSYSSFVSFDGGKSYPMALNGGAAMTTYMMTITHCSSTRIMRGRCGSAATAGSRPRAASAPKAPRASPATTCRRTPARSTANSSRRQRGCSRSGGRSWPGPSRHR
jgi:class 3 adenylate cyclase